ncbi:hypothetical protein TWF569_000233 [Orbilia oligospora]|nr:hypothetical protein TWF569_000233 [Orbilia oligospora]
MQISNHRLQGDDLKANLSKKDWEYNKEFIREHYLNRKCTMDQIVELLKDQRKVNARKSQLAYQCRLWKFRKNTLLKKLHPQQSKNQRKLLPSSAMAVSRLRELPTTTLPHYAELSTERTNEATILMDLYSLRPTSTPNSFVKSTLIENFGMENAGWEWQDLWNQFPRGSVHDGYYA